MIGKRMELQCKNCGKVRILSPSEAKEDGWIMSTEYGGIICAQCAPVYGIPAEFLGTPACISNLGSRGARIQFDRNIVREVRQKV